MSCRRCEADGPLSKAGWCGACETAYDTWVRRHATDIIWSVMGGGVVLGAVGVGLPLLGLSSIVAFAAAFTGFATLLGLQRLANQRRRRQFLTGAAIPRAYLSADLRLPSDRRASARGRARRWPRPAAPRAYGRR